MLHVVRFTQSGTTECSCIPFQGLGSLSERPSVVKIPHTHGRVLVCIAVCIVNGLLCKFSGEHDVTIAERANIHYIVQTTMDNLREELTNRLIVSQFSN